MARGDCVRQNIGHAISAGRRLLAAFLEQSTYRFAGLRPDQRPIPSGLLARFCLTIAAHQLLQVVVPVVLVIVYTTEVRCQAQQRAADLGTPSAPLPAPAGRPVGLSGPPWPPACVVVSRVGVSGRLRLPGLGVARTRPRFLVCESTL